MSAAHIPGQVCIACRRPSLSCKRTVSLPFIKMAKNSFRRDPKPKDKIVGRTKKRKKTKKKTNKQNKQTKTSKNKETAKKSFRETRTRTWWKDFGPFFPAHISLLFWSVVLPQVCSARNSHAPVTFLYEKTVPRPGIDPGTFRSSVWRSPNWAIAAWIYGLGHKLTHFDKSTPSQLQIQCHR